MNFYKRYVGDYARDTAHLSLIEHGAYNVILDTYYATGKPMPADKTEVYRIAKAITAAERKAVDRVLDMFFPVNGDGTRHNRRADKEIEKWEVIAEHNRSVGGKGGRPRKTRDHNPDDNPDANPSGNPEETRRVSKTKPGNNPNQNPEPERTKSTPLSEPAVADCPHQELRALYAKHLPMLTQPRVWDSDRAKDMRARWLQCSKPSEAWPGYRTREDGLAFWEQFFAGVAQSSKLTDGIPRGDGSSWKPDLIWLMKKENFLKVIEGKFHS